MMELVLKKCLKCGALVEVLEDCTCDNCGIKCCGEKMKKIEPNTVDAAVEKHMPSYEIVDNKITVTVDHVMEDEHYIEWIAMVSDSKICKRFLNSGESSTVTFPYIKGSKIYSYCNKHGLWAVDVL